MNWRKIDPRCRNTLNLKNVRWNAIWRIPIKWSGPDPVQIFKRPCFFSFHLSSQAIMQFENKSANPTTQLKFLTHGFHGFPTVKNVHMYIWEKGEWFTGTPKTSLLQPSVANSGSFLYQHNNTHTCLFASTWLERLILCDIIRIILITIVQQDGRK